MILRTIHGNADKLQNILNKIIQRIMSIITLALVIAICKSFLIVDGALTTSVIPFIERSEY